MPNTFATDYANTNNSTFELTSNRITKEILNKICKEKNFYRTPQLNNVLFLHFKGFIKIENLELYTGLKSLWLENNCISDICGLENQTELAVLYLHNNMIKKIENLNNLTKLDTINLCHNFITKIENLSILPALNTLQISHNKLITIEDIANLADCVELKIVDLSFNNLSDPKIIEIFGKMKSLRLLTLTGNPVISKINFYRKSLILSCNQLCHLDERPVSENDRLCAKAWSTGGLKSEQVMRRKLINDEQRKMSESVNDFIGWRKERRLDKELTTVSNIFKNDRHSEDSTTFRNLISVDYYTSDDDDDSTTTTIRSTQKARKSFVREISPIGVDENQLNKVCVFDDTSSICLNDSNHDELIECKTNNDNNHIRTETTIKRNFPSEIKCPQTILEIRSSANAESVDCDESDRYNNNTGGVGVFGTENSRREFDTGFKYDMTPSCPRFTEQTETVIMHQSPKPQKYNEMNNSTTLGLGNHEDLSLNTSRGAVDSEVNDLNDDDTEKCIISNTAVVCVEELRIPDIVELRVSHGGKEDPDKNVFDRLNPDDFDDNCNSDESIASTESFQSFQSNHNKTLVAPKTKKTCCIL